MQSTVGAVNKWIYTSTPPYTSIFLYVIYSRVHRYVIYLFIYVIPCSIFKDVVIYSDYIASNDWTVVNNELLVT
jgi:hypothetical protein